MKRRLLSDAWERNRPNRTGNSSRLAHDGTRTSKAYDILASLVPAFRFEYNDARKSDPGGASAARTRASPLAIGEITPSRTQTPPQLPQHKVKIKKAGQRACNEKNEK